MRLLAIVISAQISPSQSQSIENSTTDSSASWIDRSASGGVLAA